VLELVEPAPLVELALPQTRWSLMRRAAGMLT
jgi:hypothetical protein